MTICATRSACGALLSKRASCTWESDLDLSSGPIHALLHCAHARTRQRLRNVPTAQAALWQSGHHRPNYNLKSLQAVTLHRGLLRKALTGRSTGVGSRRLCQSSAPICCNADSAAESLGQGLGASLEVAVPNSGLGAVEKRLNGGSQMEVGNSSEELNLEAAGQHYAEKRDGGAGGRFFEVLMTSMHNVDNGEPLFYTEG